MICRHYVEFRINDADSIWECVDGHTGRAGDSIIIQLQIIL
jgi:hypothetical protein